MLLEKGYLYHIFNQGNNRRKIFFNEQNYWFFLEKIKVHLSPYVDILAWCLMPNHFHLMVFVKEECLSVKSEGFTHSETLTKNINHSIGVILRTYTRAINKQEGMSGSLFRKNTKAECLNCQDLREPSFIKNNPSIKELITEKQYPQVCFDYIHQNPVKAGLVSNEIDYEFSSAKEYADLRNDKLINKRIAFEYVNYKNTHTVTSSHGVSNNDKNPELDLALNFVEKTHRNIFLTGKAGTGKTTFLHQVKSTSLKRLVIVAPTGVAAINAKGVTIHSFFQMPFGPILPQGHQIKKEGEIQRKFNKTKIEIIRSLDLLIIDEISMVRADLLDGIDQVLRRYKDKNKVFGGVQVLMIGDLQQLAPVVKPYEWELLKPHYENAYFFSSHAFKQCHAVTIELKHIYRQENEKFITVLNEIRNDQLTATSIELLNQRYDPDFEPKEEENYITLTTHNNRANKINQGKLDKIPDKSFTYKAVIEGKFNEYAYPTHEVLTLKKGAQVMFIKNDSSHEKRYYNGKIGTIIDLDKDCLTVRCKEDENNQEMDIEVHPEIWENVSYTIDKESKEISEKFMGSFKQIPLRLAWAITIHKSQGLTFEKAIIDAQASFAHGQTYVALSRCKSLEGIVLKTPINQQSIISDSKVNSFTHTISENQPSDEELQTSQKQYQLDLIEELFNYYKLLFPVTRSIDIYYKNSNSIEGELIDHLETIKDKGISEILKVSSNFKVQLQNLTQDMVIPEEDELIQDRIQKAINYYLKHTNEFIKKPFDDLHFITENKAIQKDLEKQFSNFEELLTNKLFFLTELKSEFTSEKYTSLKAQAVFQKEKQPKKEKSHVPVTTTDHPELFESLRALRNIFASSEDVNHYQVFTQKSLFDMCDKLPTTKKQLQAIHGMGKIRVEKYGEEIIKVISNYCDKNEIEKREDAVETPKPKKIPSKEVTFSLFKNGLSIPQIAKERALAVSTIESHLSQYIIDGKIKAEDILSKERFSEIKDIIQSTTFENLTDFMSKTDHKYSYGEVRMVLMDLNN